MFTRMSVVVGQNVNARALCYDLLRNNITQNSYFRFKILIIRINHKAFNTMKFN